MPKNINTPRNELICGKLDLLAKAVIDNRRVDAIDLIVSIRLDAQRMEAKLISRKQEAEKTHCVREKEGGNKCDKQCSGCTIGLPF